VKLRYRSQALADIDAIQRYLEERSPAAAPSVLRAIYASIQLTAEQPLSYQRTEESDIRVHVVQGHRYKVFYAVTAEAVEIIHVRHTSRRPWTGQK
jgi:plasmid stabilization system protein ParE